MSNVRDRIKAIKQDIRESVGKEKAVIAVSGGIDSSVCALLSNEVIPDQLLSVYIRTGFNLDKEERNLVKLFKKQGIRLKILKREKEYFNELRNIKDSWKRRYTFGVISLKNIKKYAESIGASVLINGVNKNDKEISNIVNSSKQRAKEVKEVLGLKLVEPIADIYKGGVKKIALNIGLKEIINKQHIPGPALVIRISGKITREKLKLLKEINEFTDSQVNEKYWQFFPFLLDERLDNKFLIILRAVTSKDGGFSAEVKYDLKLLNKLAMGILKKYPKVGRVLFDISPKPPVTIEFM
ncbi:MAG: phosphoadenosine phosphosulfate reductase family protein [Candidatus Nanoarchaeia archaeon]|nr:phosphoadenosine phosphosulfate reductase family protein [Candidatus Nanoarchaeia archaeon]